VRLSHATFVTFSCGMKGQQFTDSIGGLQDLESMEVEQCDFNRRQGKFLAVSIVGSTPAPARTKRRGGACGHRTPDALQL
jgi:hypothetical protein